MVVPYHRLYDTKFVLATRGVIEYRELAAEDFPFFVSGLDKISTNFVRRFC